MYFMHHARLLSFTLYLCASAFKTCLGMKVIGRDRCQDRLQKQPRRMLHIGVLLPGQAAIHLQSSLPYKAVLMREMPIKKTVTPVAQGRNVRFQIDHLNYNLDSSREIWLKSLE